MGKSIPVAVGDMTFPSQKAAEDHFRSIRDKYVNNVRIDDADYAQLMSPRARPASATPEVLKTATR